MKLYYSPAACSLATHITLHETGNTFDIIKVTNGVAEDGSDFKKMNPHGYVPVLQLDNGEVLTEGVVIMQYLADQSPAVDIAPANGTFERTRLQERLNYLTTEVHKAFVPLFSDASDDDEKQKAKLNISNKFNYLDKLLAEREYLLGKKISIADFYLVVIANWTNFTGMSLNDWPNISRLSKQVISRKSAQLAMKAEGLIT